MKRQAIYTIILTIGFAGLISCTRRHSEPITGKTVDQGNERVRNGQILYNRYCDKCHPGGDAGLGPEVVGKPGFARRFQVRHGMGVMPAFHKGEISKHDLGDMMAYLRNLKHLK